MIFTQESATHDIQWGIVHIREREGSSTTRPVPCTIPVGSWDDMWRGIRQALDRTDALYLSFGFVNVWAFD